MTLPCPEPRAWKVFDQLMTFPFCEHRHFCDFESANGLDHRLRKLLLVYVVILYLYSGCVSMVLTPRVCHLLTGSKAVDCDYGWHSNLLCCSHDLLLLHAYEYSPLLSSVYRSAQLLKPSL